MTLTRRRLVLLTATGTAAAGCVAFFALREQRHEATAQETAPQVVAVAINDETDLDLRLHNPDAVARGVLRVDAPAGWTVTAQPAEVPPGGEAVLSLKVRPSLPGTELVAVGVHYTGREAPELHPLRVEVSLPAALPDPAATAAEWKQWQEAGLLVSGREAVTAAAESILADLRAPEDFQRGHADGALSVTLAMLESGTLLRSGRPVVVMEQGAASPPLVRRLLGLRTAGKAKLQLLAGGLRAWRDAGGKLAGGATEDAALYSISPADLLSLRGRPGWHFAPASASGFLGTLFTPEAAGDERQFTIVASGHGESYQATESGAAAPGTLYLAGGTAGLLEHLRTADRPRQSRRITLTHTAARGPRGIPAAGGGSCCAGR